MGPTEGVEISAFGSASEKNVFIFFESQQPLWWKKSLFKPWLYVIYDCSMNSVPILPSLSLKRGGLMEIDLPAEWISEERITEAMAGKEMKGSYFVCVGFFFNPYATEDSLNVKRKKFHAMDISTLERRFSCAEDNRAIHGTIAWSTSKNPVLLMGIHQSKTSQIVSKASVKICLVIS